MEWNQQKQNKNQSKNWLCFGFDQNIYIYAYNIYGMLNCTEWCGFLFRYFVVIFDANPIHSNTQKRIQHSVHTHLQLLLKYTYTRLNAHIDTLTHRYHIYIDQFKPIHTLTMVSCIYILFTFVCVCSMLLTRFSLCKSAIINLV